MNIGFKIKELRIEKNISQGVLAKAIGVNRRAVGFWEKGTNEPKATYIYKLAKYFGVSADYLLGLNDF